MKLKRVLAGVAVAGGLLAASPVGASANVMWCVGDSPVQMSSSSGTNFTVNAQVYTSGPKQHLSQQLTEEVTTAPDGSGGTLVTIYMHGPAGANMTVVASVNKYKVSGQASGVGEVAVTLDVPVA